MSSALVPHLEQLVDDEHPVAHDLAIATAEALASASPPIPLSGPAIAPALRQLEHVLPPDVRVAFLRERAGKWEARPYDPNGRRQYGNDAVGYGSTLGAAIRELCAQLTDPVCAATRQLAL
jgi:hypothetical protein